MTHRLGTRLRSSFFRSGRRSEALRAAEIGRNAGRLADLTDDQRQAVDEITRAVLNKLLHEPTVRLKELDPSANTDILKLRAIEDLFALRTDGSPARGDERQPAEEDAPGRRSA